FGGLARQVACNTRTEKVTTARLEIVATNLPRSVAHFSPPRLLPLLDPNLLIGIAQQRIFCAKSHTPSWATRLNCKNAKMRRPNSAANLSFDKGRRFGHDPPSARCCLQVMRYAERLTFYTVLLGTMPHKYAT